MQPSTLPGRSYVSVGSERKSRLLFHWRARDFSLTPLTGQTPSFSRSTAGGAVIDRNGRLRTPVHSQPRFEMVDLDGDGIRETPGLLIEPQRTQICPNPQTPASWTDLGTPILTTGQSDPWGTSVALLIEDNDGAVSEGKLQNITFTGDGTKAFTVAVRAGTATLVNLNLQDVTAGFVNRANAQVSWNAGNAAPTVTITGGSGSAFPAVGVFDPAGNLWWLVSFSADGIIAANANRLLVAVPAPNTGTFYLAGANAWNFEFPSSWIATDATVRNADDFTAPLSLSAFNASDDDVTVYAQLARPSHYDAIGALAVNQGLFMLSTTVPRIGIQYGASSRQYLLNIDTAGTDAQASASLPAGVKQEICAQFTDLAVAGKVRADTGSGFGSFSSTASPLTALGDTTLRLGRYLDYVGGPLIEFKIARGLFTLQHMREAF